MTLPVRDFTKLYEESGWNTFQVGEDEQKVYLNPEASRGRFHMDALRSKIITAHFESKVSDLYTWIDSEQVEVSKLSHWHVFKLSIQMTWNQEGGKWKMAALVVKAIAIVILLGGVAVFSMGPMKIIFQDIEAVNTGFDALKDRLGALFFSGIALLLAEGFYSHVKESQIGINFRDIKHFYDREGPIECRTLKKVKSSMAKVMVQDLKNKKREDEKLGQSLLDPISEEPISLDQLHSSAVLLIDNQACLITEVVLNLLDHNLKNGCLYHPLEERYSTKEETDNMVKEISTFFCLKEGRFLKCWKKTKQITDEQLTRIAASLYKDDSWNEMPKEDQEHILKDLQEQGPIMQRRWRFSGLMPEEIQSKYLSSFDVWNALDYPLIIVS